jgi:Ribonuclease G/E
MITITDNTNVIQFDFGEYNKITNIQKTQIISITHYFNDVFVKYGDNKIMVIHFSDVLQPISRSAEELAETLVTYLNNSGLNYFIEKFIATEGQIEFVPVIETKPDSRVEIDGRIIYYETDFTITVGKLEMVAPCTNGQVVVIYSHA